MENDPAQQLEVHELAAEMERDPLSKALWENAQYRVIIRKLQAQNQLLKDRVDDLERQKQ
ncbi:MAG TPA: hypothetical protein VF174_09620 [Micromonosporaceae bacterium]